MSRPLTKPGGFSDYDILYGAQISDIDAKASSGLDTTAGNSDTLASSVSVTGSISVNSGGTLTMNTGSNLQVNGANVNINSGVLTVGAAGSLVVANGGNFTVNSGASANLNLGNASSINIGSTATLSIGTGGTLNIGSGSTALLASGATLTFSSGSIVAAAGQLAISGTATVTGTIKLDQNVFLNGTSTAGAAIPMIGVTNSFQIGNNVSTMVLGSTSFPLVVQSNATTVKGPLVINTGGTTGTNQFIMGSTFVSLYSPTRSRNMMKSAVNIYRGQIGGWTVGTDSSALIPYLSSSTLNSVSYYEVPKVGVETNSLIAVSCYYKLSTSASGTMNVYGSFAQDTTRYLIGSASLGGAGGVFQNASLTNINVSNTYDDVFIECVCNGSTVIYIAQFTFAYILAAPVNF